MMTDLEIVEADWKKNNSNYPLEKCLEAYRVATESKIWYRYRSGNSLLFVRRVKEHNGIFHFVNADRMSDFIKNVTECLKECKKDGFNEIYTYFQNPKVLEVAHEVPFKCSTTLKTIDGKLQYAMKVEL